MNVGTRFPIVLVHGAWFTPEVWTSTAEWLRDAGFTVVVPRLHQGSLHADTAAVQHAIDQVGGKAVVCGHSYGGAVITGLAPQSLVHLVYLAAVMPDEHETAMSMLEAAPTPLRQAIQTTGEPGVTRLDDRIAAEALFGLSAPEEAAARAAALVPQEMTAGDQVPERVAWRTVPSLYVACDQDLAVSPEVQRGLAARASRSVTWHSDHTPFLREPARVGALLADVAAGA